LGSDVVLSLDLKRNAAFLATLKALELNFYSIIAFVLTSLFLNATQEEEDKKTFELFLSNN